MTDPLPYEVEVKFRVQDSAGLLDVLTKLGVEFGPAETQTDQYFQHPARSFVDTDEALRLRSIGEHTVLTYKGPVIDRETKTRQELEVPLAPGHVTAETMVRVLEQLSFIPVREVRKSRRSGQLMWDGLQVTCSWDEVPKIGTFVELELVTDEAGRIAAQQAVLSLAWHCGLIEQEPRSYLQMTLEQDQELRAGSRPR